MKSVSNVQSPKSAAQRALIVDTALARFRRFGIRRVTLEELARELRISKKTLYRHFVDKEDLVRACVGHFTEKVIPAVSAAITGSGPSSRRLLAVWSAFAQVPRLVTPELLQDLRADYPHLWNEIDERRRRVVIGMESLFAEGIAAGEIRPDIHPRAATRIVLAALEGVMVPEVLARGEFTSAEAVQTMMTLLVRGLFVRPPRKWPQIGTSE